METNITRTIQSTLRKLPLVFMFALCFLWCQSGSAQHLAKAVTDVQPAASGIVSNVDVTFDLTIGNAGPGDLTNIQLTDDLFTQLNTAFVSIVGAPAITASTATMNPSLSPAFQSVPANALILAGNDGVVAAGEEITIQFTAELALEALGAINPLMNQALLTADGGIADLSDNGTDPLTDNAAGAFDDATPLDLPAIGMNEYLCTLNDGTEEGCCVYTLELFDTGLNGWDGAMLIVSLDEDTPTNYTISTTDNGGLGNFVAVELPICDGGTIDVMYMNGAFEDEHYWRILDTRGNIVHEAGPQPTAGTTQRFKAVCPTNTCADQTEDLTIRITLGVFPEEQSWELYTGEASTTTQGTQVLGVTATAYAGLAPGTELYYDITLDLCGTYTFVAFDGYNDGWDFGTWEILTDNLNYGTEITDFLDSDFGQSVVLASPNSPFFPLSGYPFGDEDRTQFTLPCEATCTTVDITNADVNTCITPTAVVLPVEAPEVCYPNCTHGSPAACITVQQFVLVGGIDYAVIEGTAVPYTGQTSATFDGDALGDQATIGFLPIGCHKYVTKYTYCDGIMVKCTADINVVTTTNPVMTCNDNVLVSLAAPNADDNNFTGSIQDDINECVVRITPDMVLEMPASQCEGIFEEYEVTVIDANGAPLVVYSDRGLPLDPLGFEIFPGANTEPANDLVSPAELMQTLTYVVTHKISGVSCWGTLTVEDKIAPVIICHDYDLHCTNPNALNENFRDTTTFEAAAELPANIAGGTPGLESNTWIPVNTKCYGISDIFYGIEVNVDLTHDELDDLQIYLHLPTALNNAIIANGGVGGPYLLADNNDVDASNTFVPSILLPELAEILGEACKAGESTNPEYFITENSANFTPGNLGGTWYIQIVDNDNGTLDPPGTPVGGGEITAASIELVCGFPLPYTAYDCSLEEVNLLNEMVVETNCDQSDWNGAQIMRVWQAVDKFGNSTTCTQTVNLKAPMMDQIEKPADLNFECDDDIPTDFAPLLAGVPTFGCYELSDDYHAVCDISFTYEDNILNICGDNFKIIRTWTFVNWCTGVTKTHEQIIKVEDTQGPIIAQDDITVSTDTNACSADVNLNSDNISDACSPIQSVVAFYTLGGNYINDGQTYTVDITNGGTLANLPLGTTTIELKATDVCLNVTVETIEITVVDLTVPVAICDDELHVSLGGDGTARVYAEDIDEGSYDNCGDITLEVRRTDGCLGLSAWDEYVSFECCDMDEFVTIELRVTDEAGNTNICWKEILVEDPIAPVIVCPADKTLTCNDPLVHNPFGFANADDNCEVTITHVDAGELDQCKAGTLTRTFTASDASEKSADVECTQTVTVVHVSDFTVQFPADLTLTTCPDGINGGEPLITDADCELVAVASEDQRFDIVSDACYKIERTWTIVNWCVYDQASANNTALGLPQPLPRTYQDDGDGYFQWVQTIKVLDEEAPIIDCPADQTFCDFTDACEGEAQLPIQATDDCSDDDALEYTFKIDLFNNGVVDIVNNNSNDATGIYPYGTHLIKWIVEDGCGNTAVCTYLFTIADCKNPTPVCLNGITIPTMNSNGCVDIWASDLLEYAFDNCTNDDFVENSVKMRRSGTNDALATSLTLCCNELGTILVEIWVEDEAGNTDYCTTYIILQDNFNTCDNDGGSAAIAGTIATEYNTTVEAVNMSIDGNNGMNNTMSTDANGGYVFNNLGTSFNYEVSAEKDVQPLNGVSTYDLVLMSQHILGINNLDTPYKLIAADVNNDGNITTFDIVQTRQLILYVITDFPSNTAWRFVSGNHVFVNPQNPWATAFPESINYDNMTSNHMDANFIAIKVGDVSGDAVANSVLGTSDRNAKSTLLMNIEDTTVEAGATTTVDFRANDFNAVNGYQFTLNFDASAVNYAGFKAGALNVTDANFGLTMLTEGVITTSWNASEAANVANDEVLFSLTFTATQAVVLSEAIAISNRYTKAEAYKGTALANVQLAFNTANGTAVAGEAFALYQNTPNPFNDATTVSFNLPAASKATLTIYDLSGRVLSLVEGTYAKGMNTITVESKNLTAGVLYYQLDTDTDSATRKMIILE